MTLASSYWAFIQAVILFNLLFRLPHRPLTDSLWTPFQLLELVFIVFFVDIFVFLVEVLWLILEILIAHKLWGFILILIIIIILSISASRSEIHPKPSVASPVFIIIIIYSGLWPMWSKFIKIINRFFLLNVKSFGFLFLYLRFLRWLLLLSCLLLTLILYFILNSWSPLLLGRAIRKFLIWVGKWLLFNSCQSSCTVNWTCWSCLLILNSTLFSYRVSSLLFLIDVRKRRRYCQNTFYYWLNYRFILYFLIWTLNSITENKLIIPLRPLLRIWWIVLIIIWRITTFRLAHIHVHWIKTTFVIGHACIFLSLLQQYIFLDYVSIHLFHLGLQLIYVSVPLNDRIFSLL